MSITKLSPTASPLRDELLRLSDAGLAPLGPTSQYYHALVPKDLAGNIEFRERVLRLGFESEDWAEEIRVLCSRDALFWISVAGWTLDPLRFGKQPVRPFIPYPYQERAIPELLACVGVEDVAIPKTRDLGASWMCLLCLMHPWQFSPHQLFLLASRKAELVEGDERSLFSKLVWFWERQPIWLRPRMKKTQMHMENLDNGSRFDGEATVERLGTGDRRTAILLDEYAQMENADQVATSTRDVTACRIFNSTPRGRYGTGQAFFTRCRSSSTTRKIFLHWSEHPLKNQGLYKLVNGEKVPLGPDYDWKQDYDFEQLCFHGDNKPRSPWYDREVERENNNVIAIAQELDIDFQGSSEKLIDDEVIAYAATATVRPPVAEGRLQVDTETCAPTWHRSPGGPFKVWCPMDNHRPQPGQYSVGVDISAGTGGAFTSNSAIVVFDKRTGEQAAEFADNRIPPDKFALFAIGVCKWFYDAQMVPEVNGPLGTTFINHVKDFGWWNVWRRKVEQVGHDKFTEKLGYQNQDAGAGILMGLQKGIREQRCSIRSQRILTEMLEYEWDESGKIVHAGSKASTIGSDQGKTHGDVAIAAGCAWLGVPEVAEAEDEPKERELTPGTVGFRLKMFAAERERQEETDWDW